MTHREKKRYSVHKVIKNIYLDVKPTHCLLKIGFPLIIGYLLKRKRKALSSSSDDNVGYQHLQLRFL